MPSDALREEDDRLKGCIGMVPCNLANVHGLPGAFGLEQRRAAIAHLSSLELALGVWTLKFGARPSPRISCASTTRFLAWPAGLSPPSLARVQRHGRARSPADNASIAMQ